MRLNGTLQDSAGAAYKAVACRTLVPEGAVPDAQPHLARDLGTAGRRPLTCRIWPRPRSYPVRECLLVILDKEWEHRLYAERDPDALQARCT